MSLLISPDLPHHSQVICEGDWFLFPGVLFVPCMPFTLALWFALALLVVASGG